MKVKKPKIIGKQTVIFGPENRSEIVVREGDDLDVLVKKFVSHHKLKKKDTSKIHRSLL